MENYSGENQDVIFEIKTRDYLARPILALWIVFAIYDFNVNPFFFSFTIIIALILMLIIVDTTITLKDDTIEIAEKRWLPVLSGARTLFISDIKDISYTKPDFSILVFVLNLFIRYGTLSPSKRDSFVTILFKDNSKPYVINNGSSKQKGKLAQLVKSKVNSKK